MKGRPLTPVCKCGRYSEVASGKDIYPHRPDLAHLKFFRCEPCDAYVGCHRATGRALGTLANAPLRKLRNELHAVFDPLWYEGKGKDGKDAYKAQRARRTAAYAWLAQMMAVDIDQCHVALFDEEQCKYAIKLCKETSLQF